MRRREAESLCPGGVSLLVDHGAAASAFEPVLAAVEGIIPRVEVTAPGLAFVPISGAVRYYGGEPELACRVAEAAAVVMGPEVRIGIADGPFAARRAAALATDQPFIVEDTMAFVASLDVTSVGVEELVSTFRWLGINTLGELARLPRGAVVSRFGPEGLTAHRLASGEDRDTRPRIPLEDRAVEERFNPPLRELDRAGFAARSLANNLLMGLVEAGAAPYRVEVEAEAADGTLRSRVWRSADPFTGEALAERVRWQLRAWIDGGGVPGGLVRLRLVPADVSGNGRQLSLVEDAVAVAEMERALTRTQALVGPDSVVQAVPQGGRDPAERVRWYRWGEPVPAPQRDPKALWRGRLPSPSPTLTSPEPVLVEVEWNTGMPVRMRRASRWEPVLSWAGPWRRLGRWWQGEGPADRYQIVTSSGALLCEVRQGRTYLLGVYD